MTPALRQSWGGFHVTCSPSGQSENLPAVSCSRAPSACARGHFPTLIAHCASSPVLKEGVQYLVLGFEEHKLREESGLDPSGLERGPALRPVGAIAFIVDLPLAGAAPSQTGYPEELRVLPGAHSYPPGTPGGSYERECGMGGLQAWGQEGLGKVLLES